MLKGAFSHSEKALKTKSKFHLFLPLTLKTIVSLLTPHTCSSVAYSHTNRTTLDLPTLSLSSSSLREKLRFL